MMQSNPFRARGAMSIRLYGDGKFFSTFSPTKKFAINHSDCRKKSTILTVEKLQESLVNHCRRYQSPFVSRACHTFICTATSLFEGKKKRSIAVERSMGQCKFIISMLEPTAKANAFIAFHAIATHTE